MSIYVPVSNIAILCLHFFGKRGTLYLRNSFTYLTAHLNAKRVRQLRSNFLEHKTSLGLSSGCEQRSVFSVLFFGY